MNRVLFGSSGARVASAQRSARQLGGHAYGLDGRRWAGGATCFSRRVFWQPLRSV